MIHQGALLGGKQKEQAQQQRQSSDKGWFGKAATSAGLGMLGGGIETLIGSIGQKKREKRAMANQRSLMDHQMNNQWALNKQGSDLQFEQWKRTNYPAQVAMLKEAGLNPALLYGGSGSGGSTTTGNQGGGSAAGGNAPAPQPILLGMITKMMETIADVALKGKQESKTEAETEGSKLDNREKASDIVEKEKYKGEATKQELWNKADKEGQDRVARAAYDVKSGLTEYQKSLLANWDKSTIDAKLQKAVKEGVLYENDIKEYKAELAKAKIDPDSNPLVREAMKAMAAEGIPLYKILQKIVKLFVD